MRYVELRAHSAFSFGDGVVAPETLVARAAELGYPALGLTDNVDLGGAIRFVLEAERCGIKPVIGAELDVDGHPVAMVAADARGYRNLASLVTRSRVGRWHDAGGEGGPGPDSPAGPGLAEAERHVARGPARDAGVAGRGVERGRPVSRPKGSSAVNVPLAERYGVALPGRGRPVLRFEDVAARSDGLFCLTGPAAGELATLVRTGRGADAVFALDRWREVFGSRLAVEVQLHHAGGHESALAAALIELAERGRVRWLVSNDARYLDGRGRLVHDLWIANRAQVCVNTAASWGLLLPNGEWRLKSPDEMARLWKGRERGLEAAAQLADECEACDLRWLRPPLPHFPVPRGHDNDSYLRELAFSGARERWGELDERQTAQLEHELGVIRRLGFAGFFLVMWDAVRFARSRGILCQGRGSAANSAVAYCLGITAVDPVRHGLLFERFLSEVRTDGRTEAPDIDVDFEMHRREEVLDYMYDGYGRAHAAITAVTQEYHAPTAIQDAMRALGYETERAFALSKRLHGRAPSEGARELRDGLAAEHGLDIDEPRGRALLAAIEALDGVPRLRSTHPGGFVLSSEPLGDYMPIEHTTMGRTILQFDKDDLDAAGVPKFDFLGLGGLSAIHLAFDAIERRTGERLELYTLPVDDPATYDMIARGDTVGTFQIESRAQIQSILETRPERLYDIVVQVALIRPGPIQAKFVHPYTERRRGREPVTYAHPSLEPILRRTYGVPIFQEQAMAISMALAGFSAAEADELRRAMGHRRKLPRLHAALARLKARAVARGVSESVAQQVVEDLLSFANYGFPESHAWSFALIAYATAWLKAHHPAEFCLGLLNAWPMGFYPPATLVHDARRHGVDVVGPCLRDGGWDCTIEGPVGSGASSIGLRGGGGVAAGGAGARGAGPGGSGVSSIELRGGGGVAAGGAGVSAGAGGAGPGGSGVSSIGLRGGGGVAAGGAGAGAGAGGAGPVGSGASSIGLRGGGGVAAGGAGAGAGGAGPGGSGVSSIGLRGGGGVAAGGAGVSAGAGGAGPVGSGVSSIGLRGGGGVAAGGAGAGAGAGGAGPGGSGASSIELRGGDGVAAGGAGVSAGAGGAGPVGSGVSSIGLRGGGGVAAGGAGAGAGVGVSAGAGGAGARRLRLGWRLIRGLGERARVALQEAHAEAPFTSVEDVVRRARLARAEALHLARAGAFEAFEPGRRKAAWEALRAAGDLLPLAPARLLPFEPAELEGEELVFLDYLATGVGLNGHPMEFIRARLDAAGVSSSRDLEHCADGERIVVAGLTVARQHPETAKGTVFVLLEDEFGFINVIVPARTYERNREVVKFAQFLVVEGRFERHDRVMNVIGFRFRELKGRYATLRHTSRDFR